ncbi:TRAP transporter small permease [Bacillus sp. ISL-35]|uniref:TRAP transporter small permease n=1 Tax=Bacillus sp. ISL-35 TaxID=2819122 RepID=UPI001BE856E7|nr:TRAP transporter small permease [Bacillus sp. ISL-35]MBT2679234.1 TRAP transporter small permease [Bacillus sp. ISL-35]MBT2703130.1 TRAP transporter small permease [Chryseobacterium sp. ISL-80]
MKLFKWLDRIEEGAAGLLFMGGVAVSLYGVFTRYVLNAPKAWVTEIFEFLLVWAIFIGFGMALKDNRHIQVELLFDKLPPGLKKIVAGISNIIGAGFSFYLAYSSIELITLSKEQGITTIDVGIPLWITYLVLPIGMGLLGIYFVVKAYRAFKGDKREITGELETLYEEMKELTTEEQKEVGA